MTSTQHARPEADNPAVTDLWFCLMALAIRDGGKVGTHTQKTPEATTVKHVAG